ncbi:MAG: glycoside hydrolase family 30 beta sandwich domain-containing protein [Terracidiphilus sp.]
MIAQSAHGAEIGQNTCTGAAGVFRGHSMQNARKQTYRCQTRKSRRSMVFLLCCLLGGGTSLFVGAQTVSVSAWSSEIDHSLESVIVFQSQSRERTDACIHVYDDILAQQIAEFKVAAPSGRTAQPPGVSDASRAEEAPPSIDQEADTLIVNPLKAGAESISSAPGSTIDSLLMTQLYTAVKPKAYRIAAGVTGLDDLESLAFRNPDGTHVLLTVNHSKSAVTLEAFWKDRMFTYSQAGRSIAIFAWDPKSPLVSLVLRDPRFSAKGSVSVEAKCSNLSPVGIDLRCESRDFYCSIFPVRFTCSPQQDSVELSVAVYSTEESDTDHMKPGFVTITAAPDAGEPTSLRTPCCSAMR